MTVEVLEKSGYKKCEITMYELLGLVKDGKAPKRIKQIFDDGFKEEYILDNEGWYETLDGTTKMNIFKVDRLNSIVEILEEEKKIPEKLNKDRYIGTDLSVEDDMLNKINEIIDYAKENKCELYTFYEQGRCLYTRLFRI